MGARFFSPNYTIDSSPWPWPLRRRALMPEWALGSFLLQARMSQEPAEITRGVPVGFNARVGAGFFST
jgi:hypothetical protein